LRYQANGKPELSIRVSVPNGERDGKRFYLPFDVTVYGQACESLAESLERDDLVELTGQNAWPKPSRKPGGAAIPAVICFGVTKLSGSASGEHEQAPPYGQEGDDAALPLQAPKAVAEPKPRRPHYPKVTREPWQPEHAN
jgi:hypothetical protein